MNIVIWTTHFSWFHFIFQLYFDTLYRWKSAKNAYVYTFLKYKKAAKDMEKSTALHKDFAIAIDQYAFFNKKIQKLTNVIVLFT